MRRPICLSLFARRIRRSILGISSLLIACLLGMAMLESSAATESLKIKGTVTDGGIVCPMFTSDDGTSFPLMGVRQDEYPAGTQLELEGTFVKRSTCQQGERTFQVESVVSVGPAAD